jgi:hypothetical protein
VSRGPEAEGDFTLDSPVEPLIEIPIPEEYHDQINAEVSSCTTYIQVEELYEDEIIQLPIIISHQPQPCEILAGYNPDRRFLVEYSWNADGELIDEREFGQVKNADERYEETSAITENSTLLWSKGEYRAYIYGIEASNSTEAITQCYRRHYINGTSESGAA